MINIVDPYIYENTNLLKNKLGIRDKCKLDMAENDISSSKLIDLIAQKPEKTWNVDFIKYIHKHLFGDVYNWAGELRTINIIKNERVLSGLSVDYTNYHSIKKELNKTIKELRQVNFNSYNLEIKAKVFSEFLAQIWKIHPFR
ncbi:MAG: Fic family protein [Clostridioides sp.]|nr:Fic family protein [Clostridioides sp.]